jgi:hypothetical protein
MKKKAKVFLLHTTMRNIILIYKQLYVVGKINFHSYYYMLQGTTFSHKNGYTT